MGRSVVMKAKVMDVEKIEGLIFHFTESLGSVAVQEDVYFNVPQGRMKLRIMHPNVRCSHCVYSTILDDFSAEWAAHFLRAPKHPRSKD